MAEFLEYHVQTRCKNSTSRYLNNRQEIFNKNDSQNRQRKLQIFKEMIYSSIHLALKDKSCCADDSFLNRFLYAKAFHCDEAMELLISYLTYREHNKHLLQRISIFDENIQLALRDGNPSVLKQRDRRGRKVLTFAAANWDISKYSLEDVYRALMLSLDKLLENVENQALGFVVVVDWTNFTFRQSSHLSPRILKLIIDGLQNCTPANFKGVHFVGQPWYVDVVLTVIRPFLNEKMRDRVVVHGSNLTSLHNMVSKDILPPDLGGEGPTINTLDWYHYLLESSQTPESPKSYRLIEPTVYSKAPASHQNAKQTEGPNANVVEYNEIS